MRLQENFFTMERMLIFVLLYILINVDISVAKLPRQEIFTVTQHTQSPRARRHADQNVNPDGVLTGNDFPDHMLFTLHLKDKDVTLQLQKYKAPNALKLHDQDGPITVQTYDKHRQYTVYQDIEFTSSMIVECWQSTANCILNGRFQVDGVEWKLNHRGLTDDWGSYSATEVLPDVNKNSIGGLKPEEDIAKESKDTMNFVNTMLNAFISRESTKVKESTSGLPSTGPSHVRRKKDIHAMKRRGIASTCHIIEIGVYADHTVWAYFLAKAGGDVSVATSMLEKHYEFLFAQVDCRFRDLDQYGICIRIYLGMVTIEKDDDSAQWSLPLTDDGTVDAATALTERCRFRNKVGQDFIICTTRKDIEWVDAVSRPAAIRCVVYTNVLCEFGAYTYMASEDLHDDQDLLIAHTLMLSMGGDQDSLSGCDDADAFISSTYNDPPANPPTTDENPWKFSTCSVTAIDIYLNTRDVSCLKDGSVSESAVIDFNQNRLLPGKQLYDLDEQCSYAFGLNTTACQSPNQTSIFAFDEICVLGVYCFVNSTCTSRTRVYNGSPCGCKKYCFKNRCLVEFNTPLGTDCNSVCNNVTNTCVCNDGYYQKGTCDDAVCLLKVDIGGNCTTDAACDDEFAECSQSGTCTCKTNYVDCGDNMCRLEQCIGGSCNCSTQCSAKNGVCVNGICTCNATDFVNGMGVCAPRVDIGGNCTTDAACDDEFAECSQSGTCTCKTNYVDCGDNMCRLEQCIGGSCNCSTQCSAKNGVCVNGICTCNATDSVNGMGVCAPRVDIGGNCTTDAACDDEFAECSQSGTCTCKTNYVDCGDNMCRLEQCIGGSCNCSTQCSAKNGVCVNGICTCNATDSVNGMGVCAPRVDIGGNCTTNAACDDEFAECSQSSTCTCKTNYVDCGDNMCRLAQCIGGSCNCSTQCSAKNGFCDNGICTCTATDFVNGMGVCETRVDIGGNCSTDAACDDEFAECSQSGTCTCKTNYVDCGDKMCRLEQCIGGSCNCSTQCSAKNGVCVNGICTCNATDFVNGMGVCAPRVDIGGNCTTDAACDDEFGECSQSRACTCKTNYVDCGDKMCRLAQCIGGSCNCSTQCSAKNGFCDNGICTCTGTDFVNGMGVCAPRVDIGGNCTTDAACDDEFAECSQSSTCSCKTNYVDCGDNMCRLEQCIGGSCNCSTQCSAKNGVCVNGICTCTGTDFVNGMGVCAPRVDIGGNCTTDAACDDEFAECSKSGTCTCKTNYVDCGDNMCRLAQCIGGSCNCSTQCSAKNGVCVNGICTCNATDFVNGMGVCAPRVDIGGNCSTDAACDDEFAECSQSGTCTCKTNYVDCGDNMCRLAQCIGGSCNCSTQCSAKNGVCDNGICTCTATDFVNRMGVCETQLNNGANCTRFDVCADINARCVSDMCTCVHPYYDSNGIDTFGGACVLKVAINESCTSNDACADSNAVCDIGNTDMCKCGNNFQFSNGICVPNTGTVPCKTTNFGVTGGACDTTADCTDSNAECVDVDDICGKICRCTNLYYYEGCNGTCVLKPVAGESCTESQCNELCVDGLCDNSTCSAGSPLGSGCQSAGSCAFAPKTKCSTYSSIKVSPPDGVSASTKICVCDDNKDFVEFGGRCVCGTVGDANSKC